MYRDIAQAVYKRGEGSMNGYQLPGWAFGLFALDVLLFLPLFLVVGYTFQHIYLTLAIIEDPSPIAYEPVSLNEDTQSLAEENAPLADEAARAPGSETRAITSSLRSTHRTLYAISGWRSMFRGLACWIAVGITTSFVTGIFSLGGRIPGFLAAPIAALACVQLYTAWTHIVISTPSPKRFYQRLPPFKKAFQATALPMCLYFIAAELSSFVPKLFGLRVWNFQDPTRLPQPVASDIWNVLVLFLITLALQVFVVIPNRVVLTRVQASLLPEDEDAIVPFDRSFQGKVEPAIVGGKGFVSVMDAWKTFTRASWIRLVELYAKVLAASLALSFLWMIVLVPQLLIIFKYAKKAE